MGCFEEEVEVEAEEMGGEEVDECLCCWRRVGDAADVRLRSHWREAMRVERANAPLDSLTLAMLPESL